MGTHKPIALILIGLACFLVGNGTARAQGVCALQTRVPFEGHALPLEGTPDLEPMMAVNAFPQLDFFGPLAITTAPGDRNRIFVVEQKGKVWVFQNDPAVSEKMIFLDISDRVHSVGNQQGLFHLTFDPNYEDNGYFYVSYTAISPNCSGGNDLCAKVSRFSVSAADPDRADPTSEVDLLDAPHLPVFPFHYVTALAFGPDGYLHIGWGDGANGWPSQDTSTVLGSILRIDPHSGTPYAIPADNPFVGDPNRAQEIWHYGFRHPWRFSFDRLTGDLWIADVGSSTWEEVDFLPFGTPGGLNFGWPICEGTHDFVGRDCSSIDSVQPVIEYPHGPDTGFSVIGGYVYRGSQFPQLYGHYIFGDFVSGRIWAWDGVSLEPKQIATASYVDSFGQDGDGELYIVRRTFPGEIDRLEENSDAAQQGFPLLLSETGLFSDSPNLIPARGMIEYEVKAPLWSDRALKRRWIAIPESKRIEFHATGAWTFPVGTVLVKHFDLPLSPTTTRRIETRVFLRQLERWIGYTYRWNAAQTDAELLTEGLSESFEIDLGNGPETQSYHYPSPSECLGCHTLAAGRVLGVRTRQLNWPLADPSGTENQIHAWNCMGLFTRDIGDPRRFGAYADPADPNASLQQRSRAYLAANCAICHQPLGSAPGGLDLRFAPLLGEMNLVGVPPSEGDLELSSPKRIKAGVKEESVLWHRIQTTVPEVRMSRGSLVPDPVAVQVLGDWIDWGLETLDSDEDGVPDGTDNCPRAPNDTQSDTGGFDSDIADGVGDACQCGDADTSGRVDASDITAIRRFLAKLPSGILPQGHRRCVAADATDQCTIVDVARLWRALAGLPPEIEPLCAAVTEPAPEY